MSGLHYSAAPSSRIRGNYRVSKPGQLPKTFLKASTTPSPSLSQPQRRRCKTSVPTLPKHPPTPSSYSSLAPSKLLLPVGTPPLTSILTAISHTQSTLFTPLPANFRGLPTPLISTLLTRRAAIPPVVPLSLLRALLATTPAATATELDALIKDGSLRPLYTNSGTVLVVADVYHVGIAGSKLLEPALKQKLLAALKGQQSEEQCTAASLWTSAEIRVLLDAGYFTLAPLPSASVTTQARSVAAMIRDNEAMRGTLASLVSVSSAGATLKPARHGSEYAFSVPNLGPFISMLADARKELVAMVRKGGKGGVTLQALRDRWDGQADGDGGVRGKGGKVRKKWREYWGVGVEAVLGETLGRGEVEGFDAGAGRGGWGVRVV